MLRREPVMPSRTTALARCPRLSAWDASPTSRLCPRTSRHRTRGGQVVPRACEQDGREVGLVCHQAASCSDLRRRTDSSLASMIRKSNRYSVPSLSAGMRPGQDHARLRSRGGQPAPGFQDHGPSIIASKVLRVGLAKLSPREVQTPASGRISSRVVVSRSRWTSRS